MRSLVTGGTGFLGRALVGALRAAGDDATPFDIAPSESGIRGDLASWVDVTRAIAEVEPDRIFHCGALLSAIAEGDVPRAVRTNADGTFNVLEAARAAGVPQIVFSSTVATYGEGAGDPVPDGAPQLPATIYGVTKVYGERLGEYYARRYGLDFRGLRLPSVVGPGRGATGVSAYTSLMIEEPARGRAFTVPVAERTAMPILFVDDAVRALVELAEAPAAPRRVYNIGGISPAAGEIAQTVRAHVAGAALRFEPDPAAQAVVDSWPVVVAEDAARAEWGWRHEFELDLLVKRFVELV